MGNQTVDAAVIGLVRAWIREQERDGKTGEEIATQLDCTRTQVINIRDGSRGVGPKVEEAFAKIRFGGSIDSLRRAAHGESEATVATVVRSHDLELSKYELSEEDELAVDYALRKEKIDRQAIINTFETHYKGAGRLEGAELLEEFRHENRRLKRIKTS